MGELFVMQYLQVFWACAKKTGFLPSVKSSSGFNNWLPWGKCSFHLVSVAENDFKYLQFNALRTRLEIPGFVF